MKLFFFYSLSFNTYHSNDSQSNYENLLTKISNFNILSEKTKKLIKSFYDQKENYIKIINNNRNNKQLGNEILERIQKQKKQYEKIFHEYNIYFNTTVNLVHEINIKNNNITIVLKMLEKIDKIIVLANSDFVYCSIDNIKQQLDQMDLIINNLLIFKEIIDMYNTIIYNNIFIFNLDISNYSNNMLSFYTKNVGNVNNFSKLLEYHKLILLEMKKKIYKNSEKNSQITK